MMFRDLQSYLKWLEDTVPLSSVKRALLRGSIFHLGWFDPLPNSSGPGWVTIVKTEFSTTLFVCTPERAVGIPGTKPYTVPSIDLQNYDGWHKTTSLYRGIHPDAMRDLAGCGELVCKKADFVQRGI